MTAARVMVVDDEPVVLEVCAKMLQRKGYDVLRADNPLRALEIVRCDPAIEVVVSDVVMPQMRGPDLVHEVGRLSPSTACVLMTGGVVDSAELPPDVPLLRKPLSQRDLIAAVDEAIAHATEWKKRHRETMVEAAELQVEAAELRSRSAQLKSESVEVIIQSEELREESRALRKELRTPHNPISRE